jgi:hypothetical protein
MSELPGFPVSAGQPIKNRALIASAAPKRTALSFAGPFPIDGVYIAYSFFFALFNPYL